MQRVSKEVAQTRQYKITLLHVACVLARNAANTGSEIVTKNYFGLTNYNFVAVCFTQKRPQNKIISTHLLLCVK